MGNLFFELHQSARIASAQADAARANDTASNLADEVKRLTARAIG